MFRYITLTSNNTVDKISANQFDGSVQVWISENDLSTFLNTPWLCWVEKNSDGTYLIHIPNDAPRPAYEAQIANFKTQLEALQNNATDLQAQVDAESKKNTALIAQLKAVQTQNQQMSVQLAALSADDQKKSADLDSANATIAKQAQSSASSEQASSAAQPQSAAQPASSNAQNQ